MGRPLVPDERDTLVDGFLEELLKGRGLDRVDMKLLVCLATGMVDLVAATVDRALGIVERTDRISGLETRTGVTLLLELNGWGDRRLRLARHLLAGHLGTEWFGVRRESEGLFLESGKPIRTTQLDRVERFGTRVGNRKTDGVRRFSARAFDTNPIVTIEEINVLILRNIKNDEVIAIARTLEPIQATMSTRKGLVP